VLDGARGHALLGLKSSATKFVRGRSAKASAGRACAGLCCSAGCPPRRSGAGIRRRRCPAKRVAYDLIGLVQKEAWRSGALTETWQSRRCGARWSTSRSAAVMEWGSRREVATGPPLAPGPLDLARGVPAKAVGGSARPEQGRRQEIVRGKRSPAVAGGSASSSGVAAAAARVLGAARVDERGAGVKGCYL